MKKKAALLLLILLFTSLLYSTVEYYMLISYEKEQIWIASIKNNSNPAFKIIKLNASLYTFMDDTEFENVDENIIIKDKMYHVFKKRIKDNFLHLYYLCNGNQNKLDVELKRFTDNQLLTNSHSNKSPIEKLLKSFCKDYLPNIYNDAVYCRALETNQKVIFENLNKNLLSGFENSNYHPPKLI